MNEQTKSFAHKLALNILSHCKSLNFLEHSFYDVEDLDELWRKSAPEYMVNAVPEFKDYPIVSIAWACYFGMAAAHFWDLDWIKYSKKECLYSYIRDVRGFDYMDDYILYELLELNKGGKEAKELIALIDSASLLTLSALKKEESEAQSINAFYLFAASTEVFFKLGYSLHLQRIGYKMQMISGS